MIESKKYRNWETWETWVAYMSITSDASCDAEAMECDSVDKLKCFWVLRFSETMFKINARLIDFNELFEWFKYKKEIFKEKANEQRN
jgi:hypothetical protein